MRALRLDDLGASSKAFEQYSHTRWANVGPLKRWRPFRAWGPYPELDPWLLEAVLAFVDGAGSKVTLAVTATWVHADGSMTPYDEMFPAQAKIIRTWAERGTVEVANHGLTHCVVGQHRPRVFRGNRMYHREFVPWVGRDHLLTHLWESQKIFGAWLGVLPTVLVPPGGMWRNDLDNVVKALGLTVWRPWPMRCLVFHDRDFWQAGGIERWQMALADEQFTTCGALVSA